MEKIKIYIFIILLLYIIFIIFTPDNDDLNLVFSLIIILPLLFSYFYPKYKNKINYTNIQLSLGLIYFYTMVIILIIGNLSTLIIRYIYPSYGYNISNTNFYWMAGIFFFSIGYLTKNNKKIKKIPTFFLTKKIIIALFVVASLANIIMYFNFGFFPIFRFSGQSYRVSIVVGSNSILRRLWSLNIVVALFSFIYYFSIKRNFFLLLFILYSLFFSLFFITRMYLFLFVVAAFIHIFLIVKNKKIFLAIGLISITAFLFFNTYFVNFRSGSIENPITTNRRISYIQERIYFTFNEYGQLNRFIENFGDKFEYGRTLLNIPVGFIPAPILTVFNIDKNQIQKYNSATVAANVLGAQESTGLRIGILGEFYLNFGYFGCTLMYFIGLIVKYLQNKLQKIDKSDVRYGFIILLFSVLLYSLIGQINAISSMFANYFIVYLIISFVYKKKYK